MTLRLPATTGLLVLALAAPAVAAGPCPDPADAVCLERAARRLLDDGQPRPAIELLRDAPARAGALPLTLLLARAYLDDRNDFWALRVLVGWRDAHPGDCAVHQWIGWVHLRQGRFDEARESLGVAACAGGGPAGTRGHVLAAMAATYSGQLVEGRRQLALAGEESTAFPEDREAIDQLEKALIPGAVTPIFSRAELQGGWTANALAGSPRDPASVDADTASATYTIEALARFVAMPRWTVKPELELEARSLAYPDDEWSRYGYLHLSGRVGARLLVGGIDTLAAYRLEGLQTEGGDRYDPGPLWFSQGHRGELEATLGATTAFLGGGRRTLREAGRTRTELDGGLGHRLRLGPRATVLGALTVRRHDATRDAYDLVGGTLLLLGDVRLPLGLTARPGLTAGLDSYGDSSRGYFDPADARRDLLARGSLTVFAPQLRLPLVDLRAGATVELSHRFSTAELYEYDDARALLRVALQLAHDPWRPRAVLPPTHVAIDYGLGGADRVMDERIQELIRQDESVRRGSSCVE